jgi:hypothetical protein
MSRFDNMQEAVLDGRCRARRRGRPL